MKIISTQTNQSQHMPILIVLNEISVIQYSVPFAEEPNSDFKVFFLFVPKVSFLVHRAHP